MLFLAIPSFIALIYTFYLALMSQLVPHAEPSTPSNKRRKLDIERRQDPDVWMSDGNIIVAAADLTDDDKPVYMIKCHKSVLSLYSPVFEDLFKLAIPSDTEEYEGLPIVTLTDCYKDVKGLIRMLYDLRFDSLYQQSSIQFSHTIFSIIPIPLQKSVAEWVADFELIEGPLRLAAKYELTSVHARLAEVLRVRWPENLKDWDAREDYQRSRRDVIDANLHIPNTGRYSHTQSLGTKVSYRVALLQPELYA